ERTVPLGFRGRFEQVRGSRRRGSRLAPWTGLTVVSLTAATVIRATAATAAIVPTATSATGVTRGNVSVIGRVYVRDVQEAIAANAEVHKCGLDRRLDVDDSALIDVTDIAFLTGPLDIEFFKHAVLDDRDPAFLRLEDVNQHFLL